MGCMGVVCEWFVQPLPFAVVDVFAAWCGPCLPLRLFAKDFPTVKFVAASVGTVSVCDMHGVPFPETSQPTFALFLVRLCDGLGPWRSFPTSHCSR